MFTGLIEAVGTVVEAAKRGGSMRLSVRSALPAAEVSVGDSIAVNGVCLTVARLAADRFVADVIPETLSRTTLGGVTRGTPVNLERALRAGDPLGGHLVQGHVDGAVRVLRVGKSRGDHRVLLEAPPRIRRFLAEKGSVAVEGVSLTIATAGARGFEVALIPETLARTTLGRLRAGERVNVEVDLLARYLDSLLTGSRRGSTGR